MLVEILTLALLVAVCVLWRMLGRYKPRLQQLDNDVADIKKAAVIHYRRKHPETTTEEMQALRMENLL